MNTWSNTVLTDKGLALMAKLTQGNTLNITRAATGAGFVTPGLLAKQTEITDLKQTLVLKPASYPETGKCALPVALKNEGLATGYTATQVGIFATDPDEGEVLFFVSQAADAASGTIVPSETEMPGYSAEWTFYFQYGQADSVIVTVDPANTVSRGEVEAMLASKAPAEFLMTVTYGEDDSCTLDKTFAELQEAYQAGRHIRLVDISGMEYELVAFRADYMAYFAHQLDSYRYLIRFRANNNVTLIPDLPFSESNPPSAAQVGAKRSNNVSITSGSIKTWAMDQPTSTSVGAHTGVTDLPEEGSYWFVDLTVANSGMWRKLVATKTHSDGKTPKTYECTCMSGTWSEWISAAPSGHGLGEPPRSATDINTELTNGYFRTTSATENSLFNHGAGHVRSYNTSEVVQNIVQTTNGRELIRRTTDGGATWVEEYVNPLMTPGTEYRTTERWNGKPVFTMLIDCGKSANKMTISYPDDVTANITGVVRYAGKVGGSVLPSISSNSLSNAWTAHMVVGTMNAVLFCGTSLEGAGTYLQIWYTRGDAQ